jgi:DNA repair protein RadC
VIYAGRTDGRRRACACREPGEARLIAERAVRTGPMRSTHRAFSATLAERVGPLRVNAFARPHRVPGTESIILAANGGSACRPFLKVEKDPARFAACNALADDIGPLDDPKKAFRLIGEAIGDEVNEVFGLVTLDLHLRMKSVAETGRGESSSVQAPMVPTLQAALIDGAYAVILFHCHPSGVEAKPSQADKDTTKAFAKAFETVDVILLDHLIQGGDARKRSYYSFAEAGLL